MAALRPLAITACAALALVGLGSAWGLWSVPARAWGFALWSYLPPAVATGFAAALLSLCAARVRAALARAGEAALAGLAASPRAARAAAPVALAGLFWLLRERRLHGDSNILLFTAGSKTRFLFPDLGASWLFHAARQVANAIGVEGLVTTQVLVSVCGAAAVLCLVRLAPYLAPTRGRAAFVVAGVLSAGLLRVLAGHVEVYAFVLLAAGAYLWAACAHLRSRCGVGPPAFAFGIGLWLHASFAVLLPSLLWLVFREGDALRRGARAALLVAAPTLFFLAEMAAIGAWDDLRAAGEAALRIAGLREGAGLRQYWLRPPGASAGPGTEWVFLSAPHLRYLANASFLLVPVTLPALVAFAVARPRRLVATAESRLLALACAGAVPYAIALRPVWGPWDWDLFSLTGLCVGLLACHLLAVSLSDGDFADLGPWLVGAALLLVGLPLVAIGFAPLHAGGPFASDAIGWEAGEPPWRAIERFLEPWL